MNLTAIFILASCLAASAAGTAQSVNISVKNAPLEKVFEQIKKQTSYTFVYYKDDLKSSKKVTLEAKNVSIEEVLDRVFVNQPLTYTVVDKVVIIKEKTQTPAKPEEGDVPPIDVRGRVVNEKGEPVEGVSVTVKGSTKGTSTNANGEFVLNDVDENATLIFTHTSIEKFEQKVKGRSEIVVGVKVRTSLLDEVQVIPYGTQTKRFAVGNVTTVKGEDIEKQPVQNPLLALQGRVPGLYITQATGLPGTGVTVRVQGQNSIAGGNDPLYVIDGIPYISQTLPTATVGEVLQNSSPGGYQPGGNGSPLSYINPSDIESIEVLKDADATSIYGSRAANGAVLITTKKGKIGVLKFDINMQQGWGKVARTLDMMTTKEYLEMRQEALANDGKAADPYSDYDLTLWDQSNYTNWVKTLIGGTAKYTNLNASISEGNSNMQYLIGATYKRETTVFPENFNDRKGGFHFNINGSSPNKIFKLQLTGSYLIDNNLLPRNDLTTEAYQLAPNAPSLYDAVGALNWAPDQLGNSTWRNPLSYLYNQYKNKTENLTSSLLLTCTLSSALEFRSRFGYNNLRTDEFSASSILSEKPEYRNSFVRDAFYSTNNVKTFLIEPQLGYKKQINKLKVEGVTGLTIQQNVNSGENVLGIGFPTDELTKDIRSATQIFINSTINSIYKYNAIFATLNGNWRNRYFLNFNLRRDGSSHFGPENRFHTFSSIGAAWLFSEEKFLRQHLPFLSFGKLRSSYGTTGNDQIGDYTYMDLYNSVSNSTPYQGAPSIVPTSLSNPFLQWEQTRKLCIGIDLGFLNERILISSSYGRNESSNQLLAYALPSISGFQFIKRNFPATVRNVSWEFIINTINLTTSSIEWKTSFNLTIPKNSLIKFPNIESSSYHHSYVIGQPVNLVKGHRFAGVDPNTGIYQFIDRAGDTTSHPSFSDRTVLLNVNPKLYGGFESSFRVKKFKIDAFFQYVRQIASSLRYGRSLPPGTAFLNQPAHLANRWQKPGEIASIQKYNSDYTLYDQFSKAIASDAGYSNASFVRLKNLSISYEVSHSLINRLGIQRFNVYMQGQNLLTITNFEGIDPENSFYSLSPLKMWIVGLKLEF